MIGHVAQLGVIAKTFTDLQAVRIRQHDVQNDEIRPLAAAQLERALAGLRSGDGESFLLQVVLHQGKKIRVILDQYDFLHGYRCGLHYEGTLN